MTPVSQLAFTERSALSDYEWELTQSFKNRNHVDRETIVALSERSNLHGFVRVGLYMGAMALAAWAAVVVSRQSLWLAIPLLYAYWFLYGFWVAVAHELQHKMVFAKSWEGLSETLYFLVQALMWNSPRYARISHMLHHRCTMVRNVDPETDWPEVITTPWLRKFLRDLILNMLIVGAPRSLYAAVRQQIQRAAGHRDRMMRDHCSPADVRAIRLESAGILLFHLCWVGGAIWFQRWEPILLITLAWQVGAPMESLWHNTEHIGRAYNVNDQRLATRSVRVSWFIRLLYGGLDDHVEHHLFPIVPSRNLRKLHRLLNRELPEVRSMIGCWREMFAIAREKDQRPRNEYAPMKL
ncbi:MAG: fatty acid desaturase [Verrucomicrobia bacterium]|nr:fatty acid desaturase [Verrucomicrobiota bacterium]